MLHFQVLINVFNYIVGFIKLKLTSFSNPHISINRTLVYQDWFSIYFHFSLDTPIKDKLLCHNDCSGATRVFSFVISNLFRYVNSSWAKAVHHQLLLKFIFTCPAIFTLTGGLILAEGITIHFSFLCLKLSINSYVFVYRLPIFAL
jgi:hypothetical protein